MGKGAKKKTTKVSKRAERIKRNPLFEKSPRNFRIGGDIRPKRDLTRFVRWPHYILLQRQKKILLDRLKVPPALHQFQKTITKDQAQSLVRLLKKYAPETPEQKRARLLQEAQNKAAGQKEGKKDKPLSVKFGLNHITTLIENKRARLVVIAHDVDPIELVVWLPQLCRKYEVPFAFIRGKARLGKLVGQKTATAIAVTGVRKEDNAEFETLVKTFRSQYNDNQDLLREWGGNNLGLKSQHKKDAYERAIEAEAIKKSGL
jgi:large subunit ribosomal protein L7Ae